MSGHDFENKKSRVEMNKPKDFSFNPFLFLFIIGFIALLMRIYCLPRGIPLDLDAIQYFSYAAKINHIGQFPTQDLANNGWPTFLSSFFFFLHSGNFIDYMDLQRYVSVVLSVLTIIPVYLLCRRFFAARYSLFGAILFAFDPKIITNSVLGVTEPLYIFLGIMMLYLFFGKNKGSVYCSFAIAALFALIRYEGLLLIVPLSVMFFVRFRKESRIPLKLLLGISIFALTILPMACVRIQTTGQDGLTSHLFAGSNYVSEFVIKGTPDDDYPISVNEGQSKIPYFIFRGMDTLSKYLIWVTIPSLVLFVIVGSYLIIKDKRYKNIDYKIIMMILFSITLLIPAFYAYMRGIHEVRYLFIILPIFYLVSLYAIKRLTNKFRKFGLVVILFTVGTFLVSLPFIENNRIDYEHEREAFLISEYIVKTPKVINADPIDGNYITTAQVVKKWPTILSPAEFDVTRISTVGFNSLEDFIEKSKKDGLTHLVIDGKESRPSFLREVYYHESNYPYLIKEYDSSDYNLRYHVKMYKIDYKIFDESKSIEKTN
ncbi:MAG TPA: glycosyltransferase family 39 protein [Nitrosarchaeum sp.]|nr:glycosyltransferase family 39 protein [Nitrosarchaeum sp.]